jgi:hypothetical protein
MERGGAMVEKLWRGRNANRPIFLGPLFLDFNRKMKLGDQLTKLQNNLKNWGFIF